MEKPRFSVVIPIYNSEKTLGELHERLTKVLLTLSDYYEIIYIDDSSHDMSWKVLQMLQERDKKIKIIRLQKNFGQHNATLCGLNFAQGDYTITLDDDLQHPPEEIPKLLDKINQGYFVVYGKFPIKHHSRVENIFSRQYQFLKQYILDFPKGLHTSNFAIYTSDVVRNMISIKSSFVFLPALVRASTPANKISNVEVIHHPRKVGKSNYNVKKYLSLSLNLIINYSVLPLFLVGILGIIVGFFSFCYGLYIIWRYIMNPTPGIMGWNSIMVALTFLGGLILISIAIIGEYLRRILTEVSHGQQFVIAEME